MSETREQLVQRVTEEVLAALATQETPAVAPRQNVPRVLVVGDPAKLPAYLLEDCELATIEDYARDGDISQYKRIYITCLTFAELCDIALCRDSRPAQCVVIRGLLSGKEVLLLESGLPHRAFAATASRTIYTVLEGYLRTVMGFGVKLVGDKAPVKPMEKVTAFGYMASLPGTGRPNAARVITEQMAMELVRAGGPVQLSRNAILTPSAQDVLRRAEAEIVREA